MEKEEITNLLKYYLFYIALLFCSGMSLLFKVILMGIVENTGIS